jgi:hypothetical protein
MTRIARITALPSYIRTRDVPMHQCVQCVHVDAESLRGHPHQTAWRSPREQPNRPHPGARLGIDISIPSRTVWPPNTARPTMPRPGVRTRRTLSPSRAGGRRRPGPPHVGRRGDMSARFDAAAPSARSADCSHCGASLATCREVRFCGHPGCCENLPASLLHLRTRPGNLRPDPGRCCGRCARR